MAGDSSEDLPFARDTTEADFPADETAPPVGLYRMALWSAVGGIFAGVVCGSFRFLVAAAEVLRTAVLEWTRAEPALRWLVPVALAGAAVAVARLMTRWAPEQPASRIPSLASAWTTKIPLDPMRQLLVKFVGGILAIGSGLGLGREGPSVEMGGTVGQAVGRTARMDARDRHTLGAGLSGAGLAVAFGAPIGGALFVFESVTHVFRLRLAIATFIGVPVAVATSQVLLGTRPVFPGVATEVVPGWMLPLFGVLGLAFGALGVLFNRAILLCLDLFERVPPPSPVVKAGFIGATVGLLGIANPLLVGDGEVLNESILLGLVPLGMAAVVALVRWVLTPYSYASGAPGGLFAPLFLLGAALGTCYGDAVNVLVPAAGLPITSFAIVGMSTFFAAVVRAPFTGVALLVETTATTTLILPMMVAAACAVLMSAKLRGLPLAEAVGNRSRDASEP